MSHHLFRLSDFWAARHPFSWSFLYGRAAFPFSSPHFVLEEEVAAVVCCGGLATPFCFIVTFKIRMNTLRKWASFLSRSRIVGRTRRLVLLVRRRWHRRTEHLRHARYLASRCLTTILESLPRRLGRSTMCENARALLWTYSGVM